MSRCLHDRLLVPTASCDRLRRGWGTPVAGRLWAGYNRLQRGDGLSNPRPLEVADDGRASTWGARASARCWRSCCSTRRGSPVRAADRGPVRRIPRHRRRRSPCKHMSRGWSPSATTGWLRRVQRLSLETARRRGRRRPLRPSLRRGRAAPWRATRRRQRRCSRGTLALAWARTRRSGLRGVRAERDRPARGAPAVCVGGLSRPPSRSGATPSSSASSSGWSPSYPLRERAHAAAHARPVPQRPAGGGACGIPGRRDGVLAEELGLDPGRALQELERAILNQDPRLDATGSGATEKRWCGHRGRAASPPACSSAGSASWPLSTTRSRTRGRARAGSCSSPARPGSARAGSPTRLARPARGALGARVLWGRCWEAVAHPRTGPGCRRSGRYVRDCRSRSAAPRSSGRAAPISPISSRSCGSSIPTLRSRHASTRRAHASGSSTLSATFLGCLAAAPEPLLVCSTTSTSLMRRLCSCSVRRGGNRRRARARARDLPGSRAGPRRPMPPRSPASPATRASRVALRGLAELESSPFVGSSRRRRAARASSSAIRARPRAIPCSSVRSCVSSRPKAASTEPVDASWRLAIPETVKEVIGRRLRGCLTDAATSLDARIRDRTGVPARLARAPRRTDRRGVARFWTRLMPPGSSPTFPGSPGRLRFTHALVRDTLYDGLPQARRLELHRRDGRRARGVSTPETRSRTSPSSHTTSARSARR